MKPIVLFCSIGLFALSCTISDHVVLASTDDMSKNPEQLLAKSIPFNFFAGQLWPVNVEVTMKDTIDDGTGPFTLTGNWMAIKKDANGLQLGLQIERTVTE